MNLWACLLTPHYNTACVISLFNTILTLLVTYAKPKLISTEKKKKKKKEVHKLCGISQIFSLVQPQNVLILSLFFKTLFMWGLWSLHPSKRNIFHFWQLITMWDLLPKSTRGCSKKGYIATYLFTRHAHRGKQWAEISFTDHAGNRPRSINTGEFWASSIPYIPLKLHFQAQTWPLTQSKKLSII